MANGFPQIYFDANGRSGAALAARGGVRGSQSSSNALALRRAYATSTGRHGVDARDAVDGESPREVRVRLQPRRKNGFVVRTQSVGVAVPLHQDFCVSARGGDGEAGGWGGDGESGHRGCDGIDATESRQATAGGRGGDGGDGGHGSNGGHGGDGGKVIVEVDERDMHVTYAVHWDVTRGKGGDPGRHGSGGKGGKGGTGGSSYSWKELSGYSWECESGCTANSSSAVARNDVNNFSRLQSGTALTIDIIRGTASDGSTTIPIQNLSAVIPASLLPSLNSGAPNALVRTSNALTTSAATHSPGCGNVPQYDTYKNPSAKNGPRGSDGATPEFRLFQGRDGRDGTGYFLINKADGTQAMYGSAFDCRLIGFDVTDKNTDDIFEPGEAVNIYNVQVENTGEMPSPKCTNIPIFLETPRWLQEVHSHNQVLMPRQIQQMQMKAAMGSIQTYIPPLAQVPRAGTIHKQTVKLKLMAVIPDLERKIRGFDEPQKTITVQYPLAMELDEFRQEESLPTGSKSAFLWNVANLATHNMGKRSQCGRRVITEVSCRPGEPVVLGDEQLINIPSPGSESSQLELDNIQTGERIVIGKQVKILDEAEDYSKIEFTVELRATPVQSAHAGSATTAEFVTMQQHIFSLQVSRRYQYNPESQFLLVTSFDTDGDAVRAWQSFIHDELKATSDVWNISQNGGLSVGSGADTVLSNYTGKSIVCLDRGAFPFLAGSRRVADFMDAQNTLDLSHAGTYLLLLTNRDNRPGHATDLALRRSAFAPVLGINKSIPSEHSFTRTMHLINHVRQQEYSEHGEYEPCSACRRGELRFNLSPSRRSPLRSGKKVCRRLRKHLPLDRFVVTDSDGCLKVLKIFSHGQALLSARASQMARIDQASLSHMPDRGVAVQSTVVLSPAEQLSCVSSLPFSKRLDIIHSQSRFGAEEGQYSKAVIEAAKLSILIDLHAQVQTLARRSRWSDNIFHFHPKGFSTAPIQGLKHDKISLTLNHDLMNPSTTALSPAAEEILSFIILSARCQTSLQLLQRWLVPFKRTRSLVRRLLQARVRELVHATVPASCGNAEQEKKRRFSSFIRTNAPQRLTNKSQRAVLDDQLRAFTAGSVKSASDLITSLDDVVPKSTYLSPEEVNVIIRELNAASHRREQDVREFRSRRAALKTRMDSVVNSPSSGSGPHIQTRPAAGPASSIPALVPTRSSDLAELVALSSFGNSAAQSRHTSGDLLSRPQLDPAPRHGAVGVDGGASEVADLQLPPVELPGLRAPTELQ